MPTFREDLHLGHKVPLVESDDIISGAITEDKLGDGSVSTRAIQDGAVTTPKLADEAVTTPKIADDAVTNPKIADDAVSSDKIGDGEVKENNIGDGEVTTPKIKNGAVTTPKIADGAVTTPKISDKAVTPEKVSDTFKASVVLPPVNEIDNKYKAITDELYDMIRSLQVGGIALSDQLGDREDIGITQKALTKLIGKIWEAIEDPAHRIFDFTLTVVPQSSYSESSVQVVITADCTGAISNFDSIKIYIDDVLVAESSDVTIFETSQTINETSAVRAEGVIIGKTITKTANVFKEIPFFMGSGSVYTDVINESCRKELEGTLEGDYDVTISNNGDYMFIIIPISTKDEFRRADMNGYEIPLAEPVVMTDYVVYKSLNTYNAGTYNVDININS